jgi:hypothetical protein
LLAIPTEPDESSRGVWSVREAGAGSVASQSCFNGHEISQNRGPPTENWQLTQSANKAAIRNRE